MPMGLLRLFPNPFVHALRAGKARVLWTPLLYFGFPDPNALTLLPGVLRVPDLRFIWFFSPTSRLSLLQLPSPIRPTFIPERVNMSKPFWTLASLLFLLPAHGVAEDIHTVFADIAVVHAKVWTLDERHPEAQALAVRDGRILAVGSDQQIQSLVGPQTRVIDAHGHRVTPGFYD